MNNDKIWYVNYNNQTYGPYTNDEIISMLKDGSIKYSDYIFKEGYADWEYIYNISDFDRRLVSPGGDQPLVEIPKAEVPIEAIEEAAPVEAKEGEDLWYIHDGENQLGPYTINYIKKGLDNKTIFWTYYVWREGLENWVQIKECKAFDRRIKPRGESPGDIGVTTDFGEIRERAVSKIPEAVAGEEAPTAQPTSYQYGVSDLDQEELKGKYPVKAIIFLVLLTVVLFGGVRSYPWVLKQIKENRALKMYNSGLELIQQKRFEEGHDKLFDLVDMYPATRAKRKGENYLRSKEPLIKSQLADEGRRIKRLIELFVKKYGVLPSSAVDINYVPPFWMEYFGEAYYMRDRYGKIAIMSRGHKLPIEGYVFSIDGRNRESETEMKRSEFESKSQSYIKLVSVGPRRVLKPIAKPKPKPRPRRRIKPAVKPKVREPVEEEEVEEIVEEIEEEGIEEYGEEAKPVKKKVPKAKARLPEEEGIEEEEEYYAEEKEAKEEEKAKLKEEPEEEEMEEEEEEGEAE